MSKCVDPQGWPPLPRGRFILLDTHESTLAFWVIFLLLWNKAAALACRTELAAGLSPAPGLQLETAVL